MTIALGHYALWLAGALALIQAIIPALLADERRACAIAVSAAKTQATLFTLSIAAHSNSLLPWYYRATAVWGGHEGSLLLWITILAWWAAAFAAKSRDLPDAVRGKTLAILGYISVGFTGFIGFTSNPFTRILPAPFDGAEGTLDASRNRRRIFHDVPRAARERAYVRIAANGSAHDPHPSEERGWQRHELPCHEEPQPLSIKGPA